MLKCTHWFFIIVRMSVHCYLYQLPNIELVDLHKILLSFFYFALMHLILRVTFWKTIHFNILGVH